MMADSFEWKSPAPARGGRYNSHWPTIIARLSERPGEWALVKTGSGCQGSLHHLKRQYPQCEWTTRQRGSELYARFVGPT